MTSLPGQCVPQHVDVKQEVSPMWDENRDWFPVRFSPISSASVQSQLLDGSAAWLSAKCNVYTDTHNCSVRRCGELMALVWCQWDRCLVHQWETGRMGLKLMLVNPVFSFVNSINLGRLMKWGISINPTLTKWISPSSSCQRENNMYSCCHSQSWNCVSMSSFLWSLQM